MFGRYFYFESNGSNKNAGNHLVEVEIIDIDGVNRASGRGLLRYSSKNQSSAPHTVVTDGNKSSSTYFDLGEGKQNVVIDLGDVYDILQIKVWRYYSDSRTYKDVFIKISQDDVEYETIFSSAVNGTYSEKSTGYQIDLPSGRKEKYLICSNSIYCTIEEGLLVELDIDELKADTFQTYGIDEFPEWSIISTLVNPEILYWCDYVDKEPILNVNMTATPFTQTIITDLIDMSHHTIKGIESVTVDCDGSPLIAVSFDDKATWIAFDGTQWVTLSSEFSGMTKETVESISVEQWSAVRGDVVAMYIRVVLSTTDQVVRQIYVDFLN